MMYRKLGLFVVRIIQNPRIHYVKNKQGFLMLKIMVVIVTIWL